ncbi:MAG: DNA mismatch repair endonuclease MutL [Planctomycetes bacterium]|nr:DNA mismatch repair endonuclease MutL [Planctomycetota bacterium]
MPRILQLPTSVITKIAAGEVIERPASVVKELLENSLDAGSTRIDIDIEQGGSELIRVVDNGHGIHPDDLELALTNHATSKLETADDLFAVRTMGFRGEALASIAGVGHVTIQSRTHSPLTSDLSPNGRGEEMGAELTSHGGELSGVRVWNGAPGTRIEVRHLFFNTPVRRKFLRTASTEMGHICEIFTRIALARPGVHLVLRHNDKKVYEVSSSDDLLTRLGVFFGKEVRDKLYPLDAQQGPAHLFGYIADPSCDRGNAKAQYLFLNQRWIRDRSLGHALQEGYRGLLMTGRYAVAFLFLELPPDQVDVNVHPTKAEVRFRDAGALYSMVLACVRNRLNEEELTSRLQPPSPNSNGNQTYFSPKPTEYTPSLFSKPGFPSFTKAAPGPEASAAKPWEPAPPSSPGMSVAIPGDEPSEPEEIIDETPTAKPVLDEVLNAIQVHNTYLVVETSDGMLVIDQHALHERVLYEEIKERVRQGTLDVQPLLIPEPIELSAEQAALILEHRKELNELGLGVEDFGGNTVIVTRYPALLGRRHPAEILKRVIDHLTSKERLPSREILLSDLMSLMACHAAVRSGDALTPTEIAALVEMRHLSNDTHHCPHGRPTALLFTRHELDRQFRRI